MSLYITTLLKMLGEDRDVSCGAIQSEKLCRNVKCHECPFGSDKAFEELKGQLQIGGQVVTKILEYNREGSGIHLTIKRGEVK